MEQGRRERGQIGRRERKKRDTRKSLSDIATKLFIERGFDNVGVREIAEVADVSTTTLFNYFSSIGWLVGGKTPMVDWQAAAQNWILNAPKFITNAEPNRPKQLNTTTEKDYSEPL